MAKEHKKQEKYVKVTKVLWDDAINLLYESEDHLDWDFDWIKSDDYLKRLKKLLEKIDLLGK